jgi:hypothetical protein
MSDKYVWFLNDTIKQLIEMSKKIDDKEEFDKGILFGYYRTISHILSQAEAFNIISELDLEIQNFIAEKIIMKK